MSQSFSAREYGQMLMAYGEARGNASLALRIYIQRYPDARHPMDSRVITHAYQRVLDNLPIVPHQEGSGRPIRLSTERRILDAVHRNPHLGTRTTAKLLHRNHGTRVSHWTVHVVLRVRQYLDNTFPRRWIGRFGPHSWPARSPDLTPLDFFLWGHIKEKVFVSECTTADEMRNRITAAFVKLKADIIADPSMMPRLHAETLNRAQVCEQVGGSHFEPYLIRPARS